MTRLLALLVAMGLVIAADRSVRANARQDEKKEEKKQDEKKEEKKKDDEKKEDKKKAELTEDQKKELKTISGKFTVITFERDGQKAPADELKKMSVEQDGEKWKFKLDADVTEGTDVVYPDKKPKEVDSTYTNGTEAGKTVKGIYKIEGDTITYCWGEVGKERPKTFSGAKGLTMMVIKRAGEKKEKDEAKKEEEKKEEKKKDE